MQFGFRIKAKWYHCLRLQIDGRSYLYSRGHWQNTGTFVVANDEKLRFRDGPRVTSPGDWHAVAVKIKDDVIAFYYDGKKQWEGKVPAGPKGKHSFQIGFDSHSTTVGIKDLILATE